MKKKTMSNSSRKCLPFICCLIIPSNWKTVFIILIHCLSQHRQFLSSVMGKISFHFDFWTMAFFYKTSQIFYVDFCRWQEANLLVLQFSLGFTYPNYVFLFWWCHESAFLLKYCVVLNHNVNYSRSGLFNNFISLIWIVTWMLHNFLLGGGNPKQTNPQKPQPNK